LKTERVSRFTVSAPSNLVEDFNATIRRIGFDRSKAVQTAMRNFLTEWKWTRETKSLMTGAIVTIYDHEVQGVEEALTHVQHHNQRIISSTMHIHLDERNCLQIVAVKGETKAIQDLAEGLMNKRGVKQIKLAAITLPT
jgi:CopG family nickel-responsive transcriptional regulator